MKGKVLLGFVALVFILLASFAAAAKHNDIEKDVDKDNNDDKEDNDGGAPHGGVLVLNIEHKVVNDEDSGMVGYWALDNYNKQVKVWKLLDGTFYAKASYEGKWQTFAGARSPGLGVVQSKDASGEFKGGYTATFKGTFTPGTHKTHGDIGKFDYGGTKADILKGKYDPDGILDTLIFADDQTGPTTPFSFLSTYFTGVSGFTQPHWGWTYKYKNQKWVNFDVATTGDIVV